MIARARHTLLRLSRLSKLKAYKRNLDACHGLRHTAETNESVTVVEATKREHGGNSSPGVNSGSFSKTTAYLLLYAQCRRGSVRSTPVKTKDGLVPSVLAVSSRKPNRIEGSTLTW